MDDTAFQPVDGLDDRVRSEPSSSTSELAVSSIDGTSCRTVGDSADRTVDNQLPVTEVTASNGITMKCSYLDHPAFDPTSNVCVSIHYIFIKAAPRRVSGWSSTLLTALKYFFDFLKLYNSKRHSPITQFLEITPSVFKSFISYMRKQKKNQAYVFRVKSLLTIGGTETELIPKIELPPVTLDKSVPFEPLYEDGLATLTACAKKVVDSIYKKIEDRKLIDLAEPFTLEELNDLHAKTVSDEDLFGWYKSRLQKGLYTDRFQIYWKTRDAANPEARALPNNKRLQKAFHELYERIGSHIEIPEKFLSNKPVQRRSTFRHLVLDPYRVVKTFIIHGFPLNYSAEELKAKYSSIALSKTSNRDDAIKVLAYKISAIRSSVAQTSEHASMTMDEHLALYYPTSVDMVGLALLMMLQAGWNKETVLDINKDQFEHALTATIEERIKIIWSEKYRSQGLDVPYDAPKRMLARTDSEDPYSLYNLILLAKELTEPIAQLAQGRVDPIKNRPVNSLFAYIRPWSAWVANSPVGTLDFQQAFAREVKTFLAEHIVIDNGQRLEKAQDLTRRLRATWMYYNSENTPFAFLSQLLGHESRDTTDEHYDNSPLARSKRYDRLREALEHIIELIRSRKFKGLLSSNQHSSAKPKLTVFTLPYFDRALWACGDRKKPDWDGPKTLKDGELCNALEKCIFCSQIWILKDSLPYLLERLSHVEDLMRDHRMSEFGSELEAEYQAINSILDSWNDQEAMKEAIRYRAANTPLLPREMRDLQLIFRTGEIDA